MARITKPLSAREVSEAKPKDKEWVLPRFYGHIHKEA